MHPLPNITNWQTTVAASDQVTAITSLEGGQIVFLPQLAFVLSTAEQAFLSPTYVSPKTKNISFNVHTQQLGGVVNADAVAQELKGLLQRFQQHATQLIEQVFPTYVKSLQIGRTSLRPVEISNRPTSVRKDDKRLHVDAFPSSPNQGKRILRVFSNVNLQGEDRVWRIGESFEKVAQTFLPQIGKPFPGSAALLRALRITKSYRTAYDHYMLHIHDQMKMDENYQRNVPYTEIRFPPNSTWIVQTDQVSHAAMSGQHLLEQTFYLPVEAMQDAAQSPLKILERLLGRVLV